MAAWNYPILSLDDSRVGKAVI
ncbi:MAG: 50S ribosomal protein L22, partial [Metallosphaera sp.]